MSFFTIPIKQSIRRNVQLTHRQKAFLICIVNWWKRNEAAVFRRRVNGIQTRTDEAKHGWTHYFRPIGLFKGHLDAQVTTAFTDGCILFAKLTNMTLLSNGTLFDRSAVELSKQANKCNLLYLRSDPCILNSKYGCHWRTWYWPGNSTLFI